MRGATARRLRRFADRLAPQRPLELRRAPAPLVRMGGRWWSRDELAYTWAAPPDAVSDGPPDTLLVP